MKQHVFTLTIRVHVPSVKALREEYKIKRRGFHTHTNKTADYLHQLFTLAVRAVSWRIFGSLKFQRISSIIKYINRVRLRRRPSLETSCREKKKERRRRKRSVEANKHRDEYKEDGTTTFAGSRTISSRAMKAAAALLDEWNRRRRAGSGRRSIAAAVVRSRRYCSHHPKPTIRASPSGATFSPTAGHRGELPSRGAMKRGTRASGIERRGRRRKGWMTGGGGDTNGTSPTVPHQERDGSLASGAKVFSKAVGERGTRRYRL